MPEPCPDSSKAEWLPEFLDTIESEDSDFDVHEEDESVDPTTGLETWCMRPENFNPVHLEPHQLAQYYRRESWNSDSVDFVRSRENFTGPRPKLKYP